ncbi:spore germination lipoprotein GerD [Paenibacillus sp. IHBB 10380]|uniref:spore germination lipoprotein GerD n=1 Tax=Paenibacillus sp. IHBB 10380 TaxID=1566358 RepID=UPI0005CFAD3A|nr:spore germination lipoprotein GerD [Paenibacillus sp. IHBB 10380]AJS60244.1 spore gernimation protein [Paenibacillus sp. IHBB 10380]
MKMTDIRMLGLLFVLTVTLSACGSEQSSSSQGSYKETKTMVVDILKSDEGKKAVEEALSGGGTSSGGMGMKMVSAQSSEEIRTAVKDTLTAPEYKKELEKIMKDPKFAGDFAKAISSENKKLHQELIKDPTYQKAVSEIMKSPEMMKMFLDLTKTPDYRKQSMAVMQEAMQNPLFRMEVMDILKSVVKEELQPTKKGGGDSGGSDSGGGDEQGGGGGGGGGGG